MRIAITLNEELGVGLLANAAACISSGLFADQKGLCGRVIKGVDYDFAAITKIPILIVKQNKKPWGELMKRAKRNNLRYVIFTKEAQTTTSYEEYASRVANRKLEEIGVIGIGVLGDEKSVRKFCGDLPLLR